LEKCIFINFLTGTTIQDGDKRERSGVYDILFVEGEFYIYILQAK